MLDEEECIHVGGGSQNRKNNAGTKTAHLIWETRVFLSTRGVISSNRNCLAVAPFSSLGIVGSKQVKTALTN